MALAQNGRNLQSGNGQFESDWWDEYNAPFSSATLLPDSRVLIAGGEAGSINATAEIYDPVAGTFGQRFQWSLNEYAIQQRCCRTVKYY